MSIGNLHHMQTVLARLGRGVLDLALPHQCFVCGSSSAHGLVCAQCTPDLPEQAVASCPVCGVPSVADVICGRCLSDTQPFDATTAAALYVFPYDRMIHALKYSARLSLAQHFAAMLQPLVVPTAHDLMLVMPLHPSRLRQRGFNQCVEIARPLACSLGLPFKPTLVRRIRDTVSQADLPWRERQANMRGAFDCGARLDGLRVLVLDDVMTTGASLGALALSLKQAGASHVHNLVVARTPPPD